MWKRDAFEGQVHHEQTEQTPQFVIEDGDDNNDNDEESSVSAAGPFRHPPPQKPILTLPSIAERVLSYLVDLLLLWVSFPRKLHIDHYRIKFVIWSRTFYFKHIRLRLFQGEGPSRYNVQPSILDPLKHIIQA